MTIDENPVMYRSKGIIALQIEGGGQLWFVKDQTRFVNLVRAASSGTEAAEESESVL